MENLVSDKTTKDLFNKSYQLRRDINQFNNTSEEVKNELIKYVDNTMTQHTNYVKNKYYDKKQINNIIITHEGIELDDYYNKIQSDARFETKEHLINNYYNKSYCDNNFVSTTKLNDYYTKEYINNEFTKYATKNYVNETFETKEDILNGITTHQITTDALTLKGDNITIEKVEDDPIKIPTLKLCDEKYVISADLDNRYVLKSGETLTNEFNFNNNNNKFKGILVLGDKEINEIETINNDTNKLISKDKVNSLLNNYVDKNSAIEQTVNGKIRLNNVSAITLQVLN